MVLISLAQGTLLYDTMSAPGVVHPLGTSYPAFYDYMSCMGINPCWGWLNTNRTWRNATQASHGRQRHFRAPPGFLCG